MTTEDEMVGWHHRLDGHEFEQTPKVSGSEVAQSCPTLCDPVDCSTPGSPVLHCLLEFAQPHVHRVDDPI